MLSLYIDNKVSEHEKIFIETHLSVCESCHNKYIYLKSLIKSLKDSYRQIMELSLKKQNNNSFSIKEHEKFRENISPYIDNELETQECYEFRKYLTKSKTAQKELQKAYKMQKELKNAFLKVQKNTTKIISRKVINALNPPKNNITLHDIFNIKIAKIAIITSLFFVGGYELFHAENILKIKSKQSIESENVSNVEYKADKSNENDFIEF